MTWLRAGLHRVHERLPLPIGTHRISGAFSGPGGIPFDLLKAFALLHRVQTEVSGRIWVMVRKEQEWEHRRNDGPMGRSLSTDRDDVPMERNLSTDRCELQHCSRFTTGFQHRLQI